MTPDAEAHSALIVPVPEAARAVDSWLERTSAAKPSKGVPAHITVLFPFVPAIDIDDSLVNELHALFCCVMSFTFELRESRRLPGVLYLAPEPAEPFAQLTEAVCTAYPEFPPYEGAFDSIVPHLTVAEGGTEILDEAEADVAPQLPIHAHAHDVLLIEELEPNSARWATRARLPFHVP